MPCSFLQCVMKGLCMEKVKIQAKYVCKLYLAFGMHCYHSMLLRCIIVWTGQRTKDALAWIVTQQWPYSNESSFLFSELNGKSNKTCFHLRTWFFSPFDMKSSEKKFVKHFIIRVTKVKHGHKTWKFFPPEKKANLSFWLESLLYIQIFVNIFFLHQIWYSKVTHQLFSMEHKIELTIRSIYMLFWSLDCVMRVHPLNHRHLKFTNEKAKWTCFNCIYE